jgi:GNAT superfamily N-acetyltransferase
MPYEVRHPGGFLVSDDKSRLDIGRIHRFLAEEAYWAKGRSRALVERSIEGSRCFGLYGAEGQLGFARVVSDATIFAWLSDVFVLPAARGHGLGRFLLGTILAHPDFAGIKRWMLATNDAHGLYASYGFTPLPHPESIMTRMAAEPEELVKPLLHSGTQSS